MCVGGGGEREKKKTRLICETDVEKTCCAPFCLSYANKVCRFYQTLFLTYVTLHNVKLMYLVLICMPGESYRRRLYSLLLCLWDVFRELINSLCVDYELHRKRSAGSSAVFTKKFDIYVQEPPQMDSSARSTNCAMH